LDHAPPRLKEQKKARLVVEAASERERREDPNWGPGNVPVSKAATAVVDRESELSG
jgi:hypothetical protein